MKLRLAFLILVTSVGCWSAVTIDNGIAAPEIVYKASPEKFVRKYFSALNLTFMSKLWISSILARCKVIGKPLDLIIVMDSSGSLRNSNNEEMNVLKDLINIVAIDVDATRIALVQFSGIARSEFHFNTFNTRKQILEAIDVVKPIFGITKIGNALGQAVKELDSEKVTFCNEFKQSICF